MAKWTEPKTKPPTWLNPETEVTTDDPKMPKDSFVVYSMEALIELGCDPYQAAGVTANAINESAWGQKYKANNVGGWTMAKSYAELHPDAPWFRAPGNKTSGDYIVEFYRAFQSVKDALYEWLVHFVPYPATPAPLSRYSYCGRLFWAGQPWFAELIFVGYKGVVTKRAPEKALAEHELLCTAALTRWCQHKLSVKPDGVVGRWTKKAAKEYMAERGLKWTGNIDAALIAALIKG